MNVSAYMSLMDTIKASELICRCCGAPVYTTAAQTESFCNFCEAYVDQDAKNIIHGSADTEKNLFGMYNAARQKDWTNGIKYADALAATKDPYFLYGASNFYRFFSDYTYYDVNYTLGGFMYSNAFKRSDELQKNKYNAMALISKSKEYLYKALKILNAATSLDQKSIYLRFISYIRLKKYSEAGNSLVMLDRESTMRRYASLVFTVETAVKRTTSKALDMNLASDSANFFYYLAKYLAKGKDLDNSIKILNRLTDVVYMPIATNYNRMVLEVNSAAGF